MEDTDIMGCLMQLMRQVRRHPQMGVGRQPHSARRLMGILREHDGASVRSLAEMMDIRPPSLSEMLPKLEGRGLIARVRDEADARVVRVWLTEAGRAHMHHAEAAKEAVRADIGQALTPEEGALFCQLCGKISRYLEETDEAMAHSGHERGEADAWRDAPGRHGKAAHGGRKEE